MLREEGKKERKGSEREKVEGKRRSKGRKEERRVGRREGGLSIGDRREGDENEESSLSEMETHGRINNNFSVKERIVGR